MSRIYPVPVKPASSISTWDGWPDDVREIIRDWNRRCGLSFAGHGVFKCWDCEEFCQAQAGGAAVFRDREALCDDCLIARARAGYKPARRERPRGQGTRNDWRRRAREAKPGGDE
jgi:hypothetical protein